MCTSTPHRFARLLRRQSSDAQCLLWFHLRDRRLADVEFRRAQRMGLFDADFFALEAALVVDVEAAPAPGPGDAFRIRWLERRGVRVLRVWSHDVLVRTDQVLDKIHAAVLARRHDAAPTSPRWPPGACTLTAQTPLQAVARAR
ncbi:endonuclease domain-containing protein [Luteimonas sp. WGS1318]|uniref:endonuclease domain-containing protein n=1 Tax=Luteimonas sp. WGS1318 TaxID=3366815 RepID=UPI00372D597A